MKFKRLLCGLLLVAMLLTALVGCADTDINKPEEDTRLNTGYENSNKTRVINITDLLADPDDEQSLVRMFVTSNQVELEGIIVSTSCWRQHQDQQGMDVLCKIIDAYGEVLPNLQIHAEGYPSLEYIKSISVMGQTGYSMNGVGEGKDSEGSELIIAAVDEYDDRPVWINLWGGANTLAQALWKVQNTRSEAEVAKFVSKIRVYDVLGQDEAGAWIVTNFPDILYIRANLVYGLNHSIQQQGEGYIKQIQNLGPLGSVYPTAVWSYEGDSPSFMYQLPTGMNDPEHIDWGSWGGTFCAEKEPFIRSMDAVLNERDYAPYLMYGDSENNAWDFVNLWGDAIQNDFLARMIWSVTDAYSEVNHHPIAVLNEDATMDILNITVKAGENVKLSAKGSSDPDGDDLSYNWYVHRVNGLYSGNVTIKGNNDINAYVEIPEDAKGNCIHIILEIHDDGEPSLYAYRRVIINVK